MANNFYPATSLTGGGAGSLDAIDGTGWDGATVIVRVQMQRIDM